MIVNGIELLRARPIKDMLTSKKKIHGLSYGLSEVGYDIRIKQRVEYFPPETFDFLVIINKFILDTIVKFNVLVKSDKSEMINVHINNLKRKLYGYTVVHNEEEGTQTVVIGKCALASSLEYFHLPSHLWGELRNKSSIARKFNDTTLGTDMEPGWKGFLTIELVFHGMEYINIPAGSPIAKAVFHELKSEAFYNGKYQDQPDKPVDSILDDS